jgi:hypothetical protein
MPPARRCSYTFADGDRPSLSADTETTAYNYPTTGNHLLGTAGAAKQTDSYDSTGNLIGDGKILYSYNARGRSSAPRRS